MIDAGTGPLQAQPGMMEWSLLPQGIIAFAEHLALVGALRTMPSSCMDDYPPIADDLSGG